MNFINYFRYKDLIRLQLPGAFSRPSDCASYTWFAKPIHPTMSEIDIIDNLENDIGFKLFLSIIHKANITNIQFGASLSESLEDSWITIQLTTYPLITASDIKNLQNDSSIVTFYQLGTVIKFIDDWYLATQLKTLDGRYRLFDGSANTSKLNICNDIMVAYNWAMRSPTIVSLNGDTEIDPGSLYDNQVYTSDEIDDDLYPACLSEQMEQLHNETVEFGFAMAQGYFVPQIVSNSIDYSKLNFKHTLGQISSDSMLEYCWIYRLSGFDNLTIKHASPFHITMDRELLDHENFDIFGFISQMYSVGDNYVFVRSLENFTTINSITRTGARVQMIDGGVSSILIRLLLNGYVCDYPENAPYLSEYIDSFHEVLYGTMVSHDTDNFGWAFFQLLDKDDNVYYESDCQMHLLYLLVTNESDHILSDAELISILKSQEFATDTTCMTFLTSRTNAQGRAFIISERPKKNTDNDDTCTQIDIPVKQKSENRPLLGKLYDFITRGDNS